MNTCVGHNWQNRGTMSTADVASPVDLDLTFGVLFVGWMIFGESADSSLFKSYLFASENDVQL